MSDKFKRYSYNAQVRQTFCWLWSLCFFILKPNRRELIRTNLQIAIPEGYYGRVSGCSILALKLGICVHNGTIDLDYWGVVCVILFNFSNVEYIVEKGHHVAQLIFEGYFATKFVEVNGFTEQKTERGTSGIGSTGF